MTEVVGWIRSKDPLPEGLPDTERQLLDRMRSEVERARREHPEAAALNLDFTQNPEAYQTWSGLVNRMTQERMTRGEAAGPLNESEINQLVNEAGAYIQNYTREPLGPTDDGRYDWSELSIGRSNISPEIGRRFQAHGLAKGSTDEQLRFLNSLLSRGIDPKRPFHTLPLRNTDEIEQQSATMGAAHPYTDGSFIVIGKLDRPIKDGFAAVAVNEHYYGAIPTLEKHFPDVKFIKASDLPGAVEMLAKEEPKP